MKEAIKKAIRECLVVIYNIFYYLLPLDNNVILFESNVGRNYTGNPKYIYKELVRQGLDKKYRCIWIVEDTDIKIEGNCKKIKRKRLKYFYYFAVAKIWVMDSRQPLYIKKKKGTIYLQTWHGTPLKKLGLDMKFVNMVGSKNIDEYHQEFLKCSKRWDYLLSPNTYSSTIFRRCFGFEGKLLELGYPRNDLLVNNEKVDYDSLKRKYGMDCCKKTILYAPTWRDSESNENGLYKFTMPIQLEALSRALDNKYNIIVKPHYLMEGKLENISCKDVYVCGWQEDIQELYLIADILITDYSSVMFDYSILDRPIIIFAHDLEEYKENSREVYFDITLELSQSIVYNQDDLVEHIKYIESNSFNITKQQQVFKQKYTIFEKGQASEQCIQIIKDYMEN